VFIPAISVQQEINLRQDLLKREGAKALKKNAEVYKKIRRLRL
jgi:hypothetical protein